jgi:hypothetical protein
MISKVPVLGNIVTGQQLPEYQAQRAAANRFVDQWLRFTSGAQVTPSERENAIKTFIPEPGDTPETIAQKRAARQQVLAGLKRAAGGAAQAGSPEPNDFENASATLNRQYEAALARGVDPATAQKVLDREMDKLRRAWDATHKR